MRIVLIALLTGMLMACSQGTGGNTPDDAVPAKNLATNSSHSSRVFPRGETSLEERIANYPTVVRARMTSESIKVVAGAGRFEGNYYAALEFDLEVSEYLNGTGADNITAIWVAADEFGTRQEAEDALPDIRARRDTQWGNREAVLFLQDLGDAQAFPLDVLPTLQGDNHYYLSFGFSQPHRDGYSLSSEYSKLWLPSTEIASGATGQSGTVGGGQEFLLAMPTAPVGATGASGASAPAGPTITLGDLKQRIVAVTAELNASDGSEEYKECVRLRYQYEREDRWFIAQGDGRRVISTYPSHEFDSGQPAGTKIYEDHVMGAESAEKRSKLWFDGRDSALFDVVTGDLVPERSAFTFTQTVVSARPIPAGEYKVNNNYLLLPFIPCNHVFTYEMTMTVTAPEGTVHEAFFDPVVIGTAVGADGSRGVLRPASFAIEGVGTTDIKRIRWESARVEMQIDPPGRPTGHHIDFIALDGTVVLRLDFDDAGDVVEEGRTRALTWGVCERPWNDGDLLMLRISESPPGLTGATNDVLCPPPPPQNLTASSTQDSVTLTWDVADDPTVTGYLVLRRIARQNTFSKFEVTNGTATTYVDTTDIEPGTKYIYRVHAVNAAGLSEVSRVTATPATTPSIPVTDVPGTSPPSPQGLTASSTHESVTLMWDAGDDPPTGYLILRRVAKQDTFVKFEVTNGTATTYVDTTDIEPGTKYIYRVHAVDVAGLSEVSRVTVTTRTVP